MSAPLIAFNTANLVGQHTGYRFKLADWGKQDQLTVVRTSDALFAQMCARIRDAGYSAVELWGAHIHPSKMSATRGQMLRGLLQEHGLQPVAMAGTLTQEAAAVCQWLGIPCCCGGLWGTDAISVEALMKQTGLGFHYENHPEKTVDEIKSKLPQGACVALDTGWLGTQGLDAVEAVRGLGPLVKHVHVKDVKAAGGHETVPLGTGCVDLRGMFSELKRAGYAGVLSWEDEPEDRNPYDIAADMLRWIEREWADA